MPTSHTFIYAEIIAVSITIYGIDYFKLLWIVFIQKCYRHSNIVKIITRNFINFIYIYYFWQFIIPRIPFVYIRQRIAVIVIVPLPENQLFVALLDIEVGIPQFIPEFFDCPVRLYEFFYRRISKPDFIVL